MITYDDKKRVGDIERSMHVELVAEHGTEIERALDADPKPTPVPKRGAKSTTRTDDSRLPRIIHAANAEHIGALEDAIAPSPDGIYIAEDEQDDSQGGETCKRTEYKQKMGSRIRVLRNLPRFGF